MGFTSPEATTSHRISSHEVENIKPIQRSAEGLQREEILHELRTRALKPTGAIVQDRATLQDLFDHEFTRQTTEYEEKKKLQHLELMDQQQELRVRQQGIRELEEERRVLLSRQELQLFVTHAKANNTMPDAIFQGATPALARVLATALKDCTALLTLDLSNGSVGDGGMTAIASIIKAVPGLQKLELENNGLGVKALDILSHALAENAGLVYLSLENNPLTGGSRDIAGIEALSKALRKNKTLTSLNLRGTRLGATGLAMLAEGLEDNKTLLYVDVDADSGSIVELQTLVSLLDRNQAHQKELKQMTDHKAGLEKRRKQKEEERKKEKKEREEYKAMQVDNAENRMRERMANDERLKVERRESLEKARERSYKMQEDFMETVEKKGRKK